MLMEFPALPETEEICCAIPSDVRRRINGRKFRVSGGGRSTGRGAVPRPGADGKGGDLAYTRGGVGCRREGMIHTHVGQLTAETRATFRLRAGYFVYPNRWRGLSFRFRSSSPFLSFALLCSSPSSLRPMSSVSPAAFLLWSILAIVVRIRRVEILHKSAHSFYPCAQFSHTVPLFPRTTPLEL